MTTQPGKGITKPYLAAEAAQVRNPYNYDAEQLSEDTGLHCKDPSLTQQQFVEESDINYIADRFMKTGQLPQLNDLPRSGDFTGIFDFQSAMNLIKKAKDEFAALPAKIRARFANDPGQLIDFLDDEGNRDEAIALGLIAKPETDNGPNSNASTPPAPQKPQGSERTAGPANPANANETAGPKATG